MKNKTIWGLLFVALGFTSCDSWFDVTSSNEIREDDHYRTDVGFQQTLTGCYIAMGEEDLFGKNLSWFVPELMANQYAYPAVVTSSSSTIASFQNHTYTNSYTKPIVEAIWAKSYNVIANANEALSKIDEKESVMNPINYHVVKGELLAIRAYMHFQLLRLYGYGDWANRASELNGKKTIPYVTTVHKDVTPQSTGAEVIKFMINDLSAAIDLLKDYDPVVATRDWSEYDVVNEDAFYKKRNAHLNYYAVKALLAQVYMWEGSNESKKLAFQNAKEVVDAVGDGLYILRTSNNIKTEVINLRFLTPTTLQSPNYCMAYESLFDLSVQNLDVKTASYFIPYYRDTDDAALYLLQADAENLYENQTSDIRFNTLLQLNVSTFVAGYVPLKLYQSSSMGLDFKNKIPLIRLPELYYIMAECYVTGDTPNLQKAMDCLNVVRENRGLYTQLENLSEEEILTEIKKEYQKEFLAEGEMFYYYKRTGAKSTPRTLEMSDAEYVLPYPDFETQSGRIQ